MPRGQGETECLGLEEGSSKARPGHHQQGTLMEQGTADLGACQS